MGRSYALFAVLLVTTLAGCKIQVTAPYEGAVASADMEFVCLPESVCEIEVADFEMDMKLHAVSRPGYRFVAWADGEKHLCPGFTEQMTIDGRAPEVGELWKNPNLANTLERLANVPDFVSDLIDAFAVEGCSPGDMPAVRATALTNAYVVGFLQQVFADGPGVGPDALAPPDDLTLQTR